MRPTGSSPADAERPAALRGLPERLRRRLGGQHRRRRGSPDEATRAAILRHWIAYLGGRPVSDEAIAVLATRVRGSVGDLEEALASLRAEAAAHGGETSARLAAQVAGTINRIARQPRGRAQVEVVLQAVCAYYGLPRSVLLGRSRELAVAQARHVAMFLLREDGLTATQAGLELSRDHSTVLHGHGKVAAAVVAGDATTAAILDSIRKSLLQARCEGVRPRHPANYGSQPTAIAHRAP